MVYSLLSKHPLAIQKIPNIIGLWLVRLIYIDQPIQIWPRNSFILGTLVCGLSDLDLTFYAKKEIAIGQKLWRYRFLKTFVPFLGEINFYRADKIENFLEHANAYELSRDRILLDLTKKELKKDSEFEKLVFFLKVLESDRKNLHNIPDYRLKKWKLHFEHLEWELPEPTNLDSLTKFVDQKLGELGIKSSGFFKIFFGKPSKTGEDRNLIYEDCSRVEIIKEYILFYPFFWIGSSFYHDSFDHDLELVKTLSESESLLLIEQVRWELWGLFTQLLVTSEKAHLLMHLENIKRLFLNIQSKELQKSTLDAIELLMEISESSLGNYKV